jgi:hypothetical protein
VVVIGDIDTCQISDRTGYPANSIEAAPGQDTDCERLAKHRCGTVTHRQRVEIGRRELTVEHSSIELPISGGSNSIPDGARRLCRRTIESVRPVHRNGDVESIDEWP